MTNTPPMRTCGRCACASFRFDREFIYGNAWQGEDIYTKNVAVGNIKSFIRQILQDYKQKVLDSFPKEVEEPEYDGSEVIDRTDAVLRTYKMAFNKGIKEARQAIEETNP